MQYSHNASWAAAHGGAVARMADYLVRLRRHATADRHSTRGMIWGPAEHDRCHDPDYYFDINVWGWRGLVQLGRFHLQEFNGSVPIAGLKTNASYGKELLTLAAGWQRDIQIAVSNAAVNRSDGTVLFLPSVARAGQVPYKAMWEGVNSSYANFRYWSETILAVGLAPEYEAALLDFRAERMGAIGGMSTCASHPDRPKMHWCLTARRDCRRRGPPRRHADRGLCPWTPQARQRQSVPATARGACGELRPARHVRHVGAAVTLLDAGRQMARLSACKREHRKAK